MVDGVKPGLESEGKDLQFPLPLAANLVIAVVIDFYFGDADFGVQPVFVRPISFIWMTNL